MSRQRRNFSAKFKSDLVIELLIVSIIIILKIIRESHVHRISFIFVKINGAKFQSNTIKRILQNPIYCGYYNRGGVTSKRVK